VSSSRTVSVDLELEAMRIDAGALQCASDRVDEGRIAQLAR
jgi:hypothetical protein